MEFLEYLETIKNPKDFYYPLDWSMGGLGKFFTLAYRFSRESLEVGANLYLYDQTLFFVLPDSMEVTAGSVTHPIEGGIILDTDQVVSSDELNYHCQFVGTIHSHHNMSLSWSGVDDALAMTLGGLHILIYDYPAPKITARVVRGKHFLGINLADVGLEIPKPEYLGKNAQEWAERKIKESNAKAAAFLKMLRYAQGSFGKYKSLPLTTVF